MPSSYKKIIVSLLLILALFAGLFVSGCHSKNSAAGTKQTEFKKSTLSESEQTKPDADDPADNKKADREKAGNAESASDKPQTDAASEKTEAAANQENAAASISTDSSDVDNSYFEDAVFIGDSLTEGFQLHGGITNATYYGFKNLNVKEVFTKPLVPSGKTKVPVADALKQHSFGKYYIMLGANELGWVYPEVFIQKYGELIDLIRQTNSEAVIYLQSVLPVTEEVSTTSTLYSNDRIDYYDELISALAAEKSVTYLNVREAVENDGGVLPDDAATDGVHLNKTYCLKWADYLRSHQ